MSMSCTLAVVLLFVVYARLPSDAHSVVSPGDGSIANSGVSRSCMKYNYMCNQNASSGTAEQQNCHADLQSCEVSADDAGKRVHCFTAWSNTSGVIEVHLQGCWIDYQICYDQKECAGWAVGNNSSNLFYCCCDSDGCNAEFSWSDKIVEPTSLAPARPTASPYESQLLRMLPITLGPLLIITIFVIGIFLIWRCFFIMPAKSPHSTPLLTPPSPTIGSLKTPVQLLELQAHGRFGSVYRGMITSTGETVAVKVFPQNDRHSWESERAFYSQPFIGTHDCILRCFGAEQHDSELWLITEFHERGSLFDYLKGNVVSWPQLVVIAMSLTRGMAFLHCDGGACKPPVAHRDLKSRNILLKRDMTTCIADFGFASVLEDDMSDVHAQVGTRRYMAPEMLDGSISFSSRDFVLKIDIYALGLILWELVSRCTAADDPVGEYRMPYETELGQNPSLVEMHSLVVGQKVRPHLPASANHQGLSMMCTTIEECWDGDPEARLSAECIYQRMMAIDAPVIAGGNSLPHDLLYSADLTDSSDKASRSTESSTCAV